MAIKKKARILAVVGRKGGVGKTTLSLCLAGKLTLDKKRVYLVDLDPQGSASATLNACGTGQDALNLLKGVPATARKLEGGVALVQGGVELSTFRGTSANIRPFLQSRDADYCILDCPTNREELDTPAMLAADCILICCQSSTTAIAACGRVYEEIRNRLAPEAKLAVVLMNSDSRRRDDRNAERLLDKAWPNARFFSVPCDTEIMSQVNDGHFPDHGRRGWEGIEAVAKWIREL